ncbi:phage head closure protein [Bacillus swezeyi]|uniref:Phage head-tail adapter protein n=1 Tax=Bacillus swezeyi TaxID=1925020 RepID=A0A5M8RG47_9BACI|nr:phage head closure protein [Bacillus swezeyi]KAA6447587.1 phage head-tail adapter protein [Bacillus swezeyi]TYS34168.1 phage head-tail adapter protein [Bacillus swezeyi]
MFSDAIELVSVVEDGEDELGQKIEREVRRQVFCDRKSIPQNEFFQAGLKGIKAAHMFIVDLYDYQYETRIIYKGKTYYVYRVYENSNEKLELYCEVKARG